MAVWSQKNNHKICRFNFWNIRFGVKNNWATPITMWNLLGVSKNGVYRNLIIRFPLKLWILT